MRIITTHADADFGAVACLAAAARLYPDHEPVIPGPVGPQVSRVLDLARQAGAPEIAVLQAVEPAPLESAVLVDTQLVSRTGLLKDRLAAPEVRLIIFDNDPGVTESETPGAVRVVRPRGSTVTVLVEELWARGMAPTPAEAALYAAGIHASTRNFTAPLAAAEDHEALARLWRSGLDRELFARGLALSSTAAVCARQIMDYPVHTVSDADAMTAVADAMSTHGRSRLAVVDDSGQVVGIITRRDVDKALGHGLGRAPVRNYMHEQVRHVGPDAALDQMQALLARSDTGRLVVIDEGRPVGIVNRTDVLQACQEREAGPWTPPWVRDRVVGRLNQFLGPGLRDKLDLVGAAADELGAPAFLVGGFVRDLMLGVENLDLDVLVEGDGVALARKVAADSGGRAAVHDKFRTAVVEFPDGLKMDVASARTEIYRHPGALPEVTHSSVKQDLSRRDFTINAMAVRINASDYGALIDYYGGFRDLEDRVIRVLHNLSFVDDPTRIFRAVRFEQRLGFAMEPRTESLIADAIGLDLFRSLSWERIRDELILILSERSPAPAVERMIELQVIRSLDPTLRLDLSLLVPDDRVARALELLSEVHGFTVRRRWLTYFLSVIQGLGPARGAALVSELRFRKRWVRCVSQALGRAPGVLDWLEREPQARPSAVFARLRDLEPEVLACILARSLDREGAAREPGRKILGFTRQTALELEIGGRDLIEMGFEPGERLGVVLDRVFDEMLDGLAPTRERQLERAVELLRET